MIYKAVQLLVILLFTWSGLEAQKKIPVVASGKYEARDLTLEEVKNKAIEEAKRKAMVQAGIAENVTVTDFLYTFEDNQNFQEIFQSFVSTETGAEIIVDKVTETARDINEFGNILIEVEIEATVFKHKKEKDNTFVFKVEGIREFYYENDPLNFSFKPASEGYLKIFNVTDENALILYPYEDPENSMLNDDRGILFKKNERVFFPLNRNMDGYYFSIDNPEKTKEYNLLIFVYTKQDIPYMEEPDVKNFMTWIYNIPIDERVVDQYGIIVNR